MARSPGWPSAREHARDEIEDLLCALQAEYSLPFCAIAEEVSAFGLDTGYATFPAALAREAGLGDHNTAEVARLGYLLNLYWRLVDRIVDHEPDGWRQGLLVPAIENSYRRSMMTLCPDSMELLLDREATYLGRLVAAHQIEHSSDRLADGYSVRDIRQLGDKSAPALIVVDVVEAIVGRSSDLGFGAIREAMVLLAAALQLEDDLQDYAADFAKGLITPPVWFAICRSPRPPSVLWNPGSLGCLIRESDADLLTHSISAQLARHASALAREAGWHYLNHIAGQFATSVSNGT